MEVRAKKFLGQHFLKDENIARQIADSLTGLTPHVLEIGPGMGALTEPAAKDFSQLLPYHTEANKYPTQRTKCALTYVRRKSVDSFAAKTNELASETHM